MTDKQKAEINSTATAQALIAKWNDADKRMAACKLEKQEAEADMVMHVCPYKVGEIFADPKSGKRYILTKITVNTYAVQGGYSGKSPKCIDFNYTFRAIRKDGRPSMNGTSWINIDDMERTGKTYDFTED